MGIEKKSINFGKILFAKNVLEVLIIRDFSRKWQAVFMGFHLRKVPE